MKPFILYEGKSTLRDLENLKRNSKIWKVVDIYDRQLEELFNITYPRLKNSTQYDQELYRFLRKRKKGKTSTLTGNWIYFPWNGYLTHTINEKDYFSLRTNRNRNLITKQEQQKLYSCSIGVVGLSVGSSLATNLAYQGIAKTMKLAEFDTLETTNLNRVRAEVKDIGTPKMEITIQQIYGIDPYCKLELYQKRLTKKNVERFIKGRPKPKIIFEIIDDFEMKVLLRLKARENGIPIIMFANLGDKVLVDIERYDLDKKTPLFNGILGNLPERMLENPREDPNKYAVEIVGRQNIPTKAMESVKEIGKTLVGRPQLSSTVGISSNLAVFIARRVALGQPLESGRRIVDIEKVLK